jgi:hypothetical protein
MAKFLHEIALNLLPSGSIVVENPKKFQPQKKNREKRWIFWQEFETMRVGKACARRRACGLSAGWRIARRGLGGLGSRNKGV